MKSATPFAFSIFLSQSSICNLKSISFFKNWLGANIPWASFSAALHTQANEKYLPSFVGSNFALSRRKITLPAKAGVGYTFRTIFGNPLSEPLSHFLHMGFALSNLMGVAQIAF